jgi:hypothetical protein
MMCTVIKLRSYNSIAVWPPAARKSADESVHLNIFLSDFNPENLLKACVRTVRSFQGHHTVLHFQKYECIGQLRIKRISHST